MTTTISQRQLRNDSGDIMRALEQGEDFIVTRNGVPVGELRPVRRTFVARQRLLRAVETGPPIDPLDFRRDLDDGVDQNIEPRA